MEKVEKSEIIKRNVGRPKGVCTKQSMGRLKYKIDMSGKTYYATSMEEIISWTKIPRSQVFMIHDRTQGKDISVRFSLDFIAKTYPNISIYNHYKEYDRKTLYKRGIYDENYVLIYTWDKSEPIKIEPPKFNSEAHKLIVDKEYEDYIKFKMIDITFDEYQDKLKDMEQEYLEWKAKAQYK